MRSKKGPISGTGVDGTAMNPKRSMGVAAPQGGTPMGGGRPNPKRDTAGSGVHDTRPAPRFVENVLGGKAPARRPSSEAEPYMGGVLGAGRRR